MKIISFFQTIIKPIFGTFETEEFKKFLRMGLIFSCIIGSYWTLRPLKNALFCTLVGSAQIPWAKTSSIIFLFPLLMLYSKLLDRYSREKVFYILASAYGALSLLFSILLAHTQNIAICKPEASLTDWSSTIATIVGYSFYIFVESYGSLIPALFWAIAADTTKPESAKKGFSFVVALGQIGGIILPYFITTLPRRLGFTTNALSLIICSLTTIVMIPLFRYFFTKTPKDLLVSYHEQNEKQSQEEKKEEEPGFLDGLKLLLTHKYLLGIFAVVTFPDIITTIFDLHFNALAAEHYSGTDLSEYLGLYGSSVNFVALTFLLCGISNITRILGIGVSLFLMPIIYGAAILGFITLDSLTFLFILMASSKAINYALNGPAIKQLYIPTTHEVRFKAQGWIESFGTRGAKEAGSVFNFLLGPLQKQLGTIAGRTRHAILASYLGFGIIVVWMFIALFLGKKYKKAIDNNNVVC